MELIATNNCPRRVWGNIDGTTQAFVYFQAMDFITTVLGFRLGAGEANPFVSLLMHAGSITGVFISKLVALVLGGICIYFGKRRLLRRATYWYAALVMWNLLVVLAALGKIQG
jgi:hypothetical protein